MFPVITLLGKDIGSDVIFTLIGIVALLTVWFLLGKNRGFTLKNMGYAALFVIIGAILGSRISYALINYRATLSILGGLSGLKLRAFIKTAFSIFGGAVYFGGFLGALLALRIYTARFSKNTRKTAFDIFGVSVPLFHSFCKIGCFLKGCCYGITTKYGIVFNSSDLPDGVAGVKRLPIALIEAYFSLLLFLLLLKFFNSKKFVGRINYVYIFWASILSFGSEFLRGDITGTKLFGLSYTQILSGVLFVIAFFFFLFHIGYSFKETFRKPECSAPPKNIFKTIFLFLVTFGIYGIVVMTSVSKDVNRLVTPNDNKRTMNYCLLFFLVGWLTLGIGYIIWYYRLTKRIANELTRRNIDYLFTKDDFWLWNVLGIMVLIGPIIYLHKLFTAINLINDD
ncbi:MAG: prolipoprotein diacylglyceryl transferase [Clostridia bacterium]|nr:prolipoprotein diacylglyceryl transferase [Clostridia bacterium]